MNELRFIAVTKIDGNRGILISQGSVLDIDDLGESRRIRYGQQVVLVHETLDEIEGQVQRREWD